MSEKRILAIIMAHGGEIEVENSGINQGSSFTIELPCVTLNPA